MATKTIPLIPVPAHIINIGARAVFGKAFNTTKNGSNILATNSFHQSKIPMINPKSVPNTNPSKVSNTLILMCPNSSPLFTYLINKVNISLGLETKNTLITPNLANISHKPIKIRAKAICEKSINILYLRSWATNCALELIFFIII